MKLGIVGSEAQKFTITGERRAKLAILRLFDHYRPHEVVSGACHLGGIDIWAVELARESAILYREFEPRERGWELGYKDRNMKIAEHSDVVVCITVANFPRDFIGKKYTYCYHCKTDAHVKSGGCWTTKYAREKLKKATHTIVIDNYRRLKAA